MTVENVISSISSLASWIALVYVIRNTASAKLEQTIAKAIENAILKLRPDLREEFVTVEHCEERDMEFEDLKRRVKELSAFLHKWRHKFANILTAVILFIKHCHQDSPSTRDLDDAIRSLRDE